MRSGPATLAQLGRALGSLAAPGLPLGELTTYRVGGPAALTALAGEEAELVEIARRIEGTTVPVLVLGRGSNLLVADRGFEGLVIRLGSGFESLSIEGTHVRAGAAVALPVLARRTASAGLAGLEWAVGVPGSVGGAIRMNAGGHGSDTSATLVRCRWVELATGEVHERPAEALGLAYRASRFADTDIIVRGSYVLEPGRAEDGRRLIDEIVRWRRENQPGGSNAGSVFTNPVDDSAGRLIEQCGLKGLRVGSAVVSEKHANFFQADPGGSADDVRRLIARVQTDVAAATGVELRTEVRLVGFDDGTGPA